MKHRKTTLETIALRHFSGVMLLTGVMLFAGAMMAASGRAFAQGSITGAVRDLSNNRGIQGVIITVKDAGTGVSAGTDTTDAAGDYSVSVPSPGNYILGASRLGYDNVSAPNVINLSDLDPNLTINLAMAEKGWLQYKPRAPTALNWDTGANKSYLIPALEIPAFILALNGYSRLVSPNEEEDGKKVYSVTFTTIRDHVTHGPWGFDQDAFKINQLMHPYQGAIYYGFARSAGLGFWESSAYTFAGSYLWEMGGETTSPSINDQVASGVAGAFFGEALFRMASLVLEGGGSRPGFWRELAATVISPPTGFNRLVFGERFAPVFPSYDPAVLWRLRLGAFFNDRLKDQGELSPVGRTHATMDFSMDYGLPGKPGYSYKRPFDYFNFQFTAVSSSDNPMEDVMIRGLLWGDKYEVGDSYRGIWGLYGGYDYISPQVFRVSSTAASFGTTFQWWLARAVALQGSALGGVGYGAAGNVAGLGERDYHYGIAPQGLLALRLILSDKAMLDVTARGYYISGLGSTETGGNETIGRLNMGLTVRIHGPHALGIQYLASRRDAHYPDRANSRQTVGTYSLVYTFLSDTRFGAVEWR